MNQRASLGYGYPDSGNNTTPAVMPVANERRRESRRIADRLGGLSTALESKAQWTKSFLHPRGTTKR
jgi:hypothetical protein